MRLITTLLVSGLVVYGLAALFDGIWVENFWSAVLVGLLLGLVNFFIRPILTILTLPITILTLGLFLFVINGVSVLIVSGLMDSFRVEGLLWAIVFSLLYSFVNSVLGNTWEDKKKKS